MPRLFVLHDTPSSSDRSFGSVEVTETRARELNDRGWGVFQVVNEFVGRRLVANLTQINYWFCEIDHGVKQTLDGWMAVMPLPPSLVVDSKRGYHAYWKAQDATLANWKRIVRHGVVPALGGDPKATDVLRLLRAPGFYHRKGEPYLVSVVWDSPAVYTEQQMLAAYPDRRKPRDKTSIDVDKYRQGDHGFWYRANALDAREALQKLSGHWLVNGERFWLVEQSNGNANVYCQPVPTQSAADSGAFITPEGVLFAESVGIPAWCYWYQEDWGKVAIGLRQLFPELEEYEG